MSEYEGKITNKDIPPIRGVDSGKTESLINRSKQYKMKEVQLMGNLGSKETGELVYAVGKLVTSIKLMKEDGKITAGDAMHFTDDVLPLLAGIKGADQIPAEFRDGWNEDDLANIQNSWMEGADILERDEIGVVLAIDVVNALNKLLLHIGAIQPQNPGV